MNGFGQAPIHIPAETADRLYSRAAAKLQALSVHESAGTAQDENPRASGRDT